MFLLPASTEPIPLDAIILLFLIAVIPMASSLVALIFFRRRTARRFGSLSFSPNSWLERKWLVRTSSAILVVCALALAYGTFVETRWVELTKTEIRVREPVLGHTDYGSSTSLIFIFAGPADVSVEWRSWSARPNRT